jgi:hypothetical protein
MANCLRFVLTTSQHIAHFPRQSEMGQSANRACSIGRPSAWSIRQLAVVQVSDGWNAGAVVGCAQVNDTPIFEHRSVTDEARFCKIRRPPLRQRKETSRIKDRRAVAFEWDMRHRNLQTGASANFILGETTESTLMAGRDKYCFVVLSLPARY